MGELSNTLAPRWAWALVLLLTFLPRPGSAQDAGRLSRRAPTPQALSREEALEEIATNLTYFWAQRSSAQAAADSALFEAADRAADLWLPPDNKVLRDVAFAMTYWANRDRAAWLGDELRSPLVMFETAMRLQQRSHKMLLLRSAWSQLSSWPSPGGLSGDSLRLAYETAANLMFFRKDNEARNVVATALRPFSSFPRRPFESMDFHQLLGLRYLEVKLMDPENKQREGWSRLESVYEEAKDAARLAVGSNYLAWQILTVEELIEISIINCDVMRLEQALQRASQTEADLLLSSPYGLNEDLLHAMFQEVPRGDLLAAPLMRCPRVSPRVAELVLERLLIRREAWQFRHAIVRAAEGGGEPYLQETLRSLVSIRRLQAQMQLRVPDERLAAELKQLSIPREFSPPRGTDAITIAWVELGSAAATMEYNLADSSIELWRKAKSPFLSNILANVRRNLPADGALVAYLVLPTGEWSTQDQILAMAVSRESEILWSFLKPGTRAGSPSSLATLARSLRAQMSVDEETRETSNLREVGRILIDPIEDILSDKKRVFLITQGPLRLLPWQAVIDSRGRYLGDRFALRQVQSASDLLSSNLEVKADNAAIVLVSPEYREISSENLEVPMGSRSIPAQFQPLPWALAEVQGIQATLYKAGVEVQMITGSEAKEGTLWKLRRPRLLHFAGHGFQVPAGGIAFQQEPIVPGAQNFRWPFEYSDVRAGARYRTGIALSDANEGRRLAGPDGLLTAAEVTDLDLLGTELVVLSACQTGYPVEEDATGPLDLALAFRQAGARSVVAAIWKVQDEATEMFMRSLYEGLIAGESVVSAAQMARDKVRRTPGFSDPFFWAGFEVFGEDVSLRKALKGTPSRH